MAMFSKNVGPVEIVFNAVSIGLTQGGSKLAVTRDVAVTTADKTGKTSRAKIVTGHGVKVTGAITEATLVQLAAVIGGSVTEGATTDELKIKAQVGKDLLSEAKILILKPIVEGVTSTDEEDWITIPKATINPAFDVPFELENQKVWGFEFEGHPLTADDVASGATYDGGDWAENDLLRLGKAD